MAPQQIHTASRYPWLLHRAGPASVQLLGWPLDLVPKKLRAVCVLAPPRPASATSPDCPAKGLSPNFGPPNLFLGPVPPASSQLALPALSKGSRLVWLSSRWFWGSLRHFF